MKKLALTITLTMLSGTAFADMFEPSNSCTEPYKPYQFESEWELESYKSDVEFYRDCLSRFIDEQNEEAQNHIDAAESAAQEWERFVMYNS